MFEHGGRQSGPVLRPRPGRSLFPRERRRTFRPTLIERAYELAATGLYANPSHVKKALSAEGYGNLDIQTHLHGPTITAALMKRCKDNYRGEPVEA